MNKQFKTLVILVMAALMACPVFTQAADRAHTLKVYNWADYIDLDNVLNKFPEWYKEQTGEDVDIIYQTFDINESMLTEIEVGHEDYDVVCPSEYIIERMMRRGLLQPIQRNFGSLPDYTRLVAPFAQRMFQQMVSEEEISAVLTWKRMTLPSADNCSRPQPARASVSSRASRAGYAAFSFIFL